MCGWSSDAASSDSQEALAEAVVRAELRREESQRRLPLQPQVLRAVDDAHPAAPDQRLDPVVAELGAEPRIG
jgi:hypothetical protein